MPILTVDLTSDQAKALAQFVKRVGVSDLRMNAVDDDEAYEIQGALEQVRKALSEQGLNPR